MQREQTLVAKDFIHIEINYLILDTENKCIEVERYKSVIANTVIVNVFGFYLVLTSMNSFFSSY